VSGDQIRSTQPGLIPAFEGSPSTMQEPFLLIMQAASCISLAHLNWSYRSWGLRI
jgi:hypothetical protein